MLKLRTGQCWATSRRRPARVDTTEATTRSRRRRPIDRGLPRVRDRGRRSATPPWRPRLRHRERGRRGQLLGRPTWRRTTQLVREVAPAIRAADPEATVARRRPLEHGYGVVLAADSWPPATPTAALRTYRDYYGRRLAGGVSRWPAVDHRRGAARGARRRPGAGASIAAEDVAVRLANDGVVDAYQLHYYEPTAELPALLDYLAANGSATSVPIEAWEVGVAWPGDEYDEREHADEIFRLVGHAARRTACAAIVYLPVAYTPGPQTQVFRGLDPTRTVGAARRAGLDRADRRARRASATPSRPPVTGELTGVTWTAGGRDQRRSSGRPASRSRSRRRRGARRRRDRRRGRRRTSPWARPRCWSPGHWAATSRTGWSTGTEVCGARIAGVAAASAPGGRPPRAGRSRRPSRSGGRRRRGARRPSPAPTPGRRPGWPSARR